MLHEEDLLQASLSMFWEATWWMKNFSRLTTIVEGLELLSLKTSISRRYLEEERNFCSWTS